MRVPIRRRPMAMITLTLWLGISGGAVIGGCRPSVANAPQGAELAPKAESTPLAVPSPPGVAPATRDGAQRELEPKPVHAFHGVRWRDGQELTRTELLNELSQFDVICVGEEHGNRLHHAVELSLLEGLRGRAPISGRYLSLGLEMVERQFQQLLFEFWRGAMEEPEFLESVEWSQRWAHPYAYYRPLLSTARDARIPIYALNARAELVSEVAQVGLSGLNPKARQELPDLKLDNASHRTWFDEATQGHPQSRGSEGQPLQLYPAQVVRDETMASRITEKMGSSRPASQMLVVAGIGHCRRDAIPERVLRRVPGLRVAAVLPAALPTAESNSGSGPRAAGASRDSHAFDFGVILDSTDPTVGVRSTPSLPGEPRLSERKSRPTAATVAAPG